jgi:hypothetical protein
LHFFGWNEKGRNFSDLNRKIPLGTLKVYSFVYLGGITRVEIFSFISRRTRAVGVRENKKTPPESSTLLRT